MDVFEQEVRKLTHITKFQGVIVIGYLKRYNNHFDGNIGEWDVPLLDTHIKDNAKPYHKQAFPILVIHIKTFKRELDGLVARGVWTNIQLQ